ncbi:MAG TPA: P27 family phage terminase small subunit [Candidatus Limnocylindrales bacterium]|nr:P27 family phage terminase small subunit [Candidatus Limnocylindrales bacterium]
MTARTPERLKLLKGTARPDRKAPEPPRSATTAAPKAPAWLDKYGRAKWTELVPELASRRLLTGDALSLLELLCEAWADFRRAQAVVRASGGSYESKKGEEGKGDTMRRRVPEVEQARDARKEYARLLATFSALIANVQPDEQKDPLGKFLDGGPRGNRSSTG